MAKGGIEMTRLLSLDTSTTSTGCAVYENGKLKETKLIVGDKKVLAEDRIRNILKSIFDYISEISPDIVVFETPSIARNAKTQRELCFVAGGVMGICTIKDIFYYEMRPSEWRKIVKSKDEVLPRKRAELKEWAIQKVKTDFGIEVGDDIADAVLMGKAYIKEFS